MCLCLLGESKIIQLLDAFCAFNRGFLVFEVWGRSLDGLLREKKCTPHDVKGLLKQGLEALQQLKKHKIIHFDIKPANILVKFPEHPMDIAGHQTLVQAPSPQKLLKLCDLGGAMTAEIFQQLQLATRQLRLQSLPYRAPEVMLEAKNCSYPVDMWSLACVMYDIAVGGEHLYFQCVSPHHGASGTQENKTLLSMMLQKRPENSDHLTVTRILSFKNNN